LFRPLCLHVALDGAADGNRHGRTAGTYIKIGEDIRKIVEPSGIYLQVFESAGSIQNVFDVRKKRGVQLGIVQSDVLEYIRDISDDQELKVIAPSLLPFIRFTRRRSTFSVIFP